VALVVLVALVILVAPIALVAPVALVVLVAPVAGFSTSQDDLGKTKRSLGLGAAYLVSS
jgi:hypothetical protein